MKRAAAFLLVLCMVVTLIPSVAMAKESDVNTTTDSTNSTTNSTYNDTDGTDTDSKSISTKTDSTTNSTTNSTDSTTNSTSNSTTNSTENLSNEEKEKYPEFTPLPYIIDGVIVSVSAPAGVFPKGATYKVTKVDDASKKLGDEAVDKIDDNNRIIAKSYTYDIKVYDEKGNSIQPKDATKVNVSFKMREVSDANLDTEIYHINEIAIPEDTDKTDKKDDNLNLAKSDPSVVVDEAKRIKLSAEKLTLLEDKDLIKAEEYESNVLVNAIKDEQTAVVESNSFSTYVVNFTYTTKHYTVNDGETITIDAIKNGVGLTGTVTAASSSDEQLLQVNGTTSVKPLQQFYNPVVLTLNINSTEYKINVIAISSETPKSDVSSWDELQNALDSYESGRIIQLSQDIDGKDKDTLTVSKDKNLDVVLDLKGHTINKNGDDKVIHIKDGYKLTIIDTVGTGVITGGDDAEYGGAIDVGFGSTLTLNGGTISGNEADNGGAINNNGTIIINNAKIDGNEADDGGAIYNNGTLIMNGGIISGNKAENGGAIYSRENAGFTLKDVEITNNSASDEGGAIYIDKGADSTLNNCTITRNSSEDIAGAIYMESSGKTLTITDTKIKNNTSEDDGAGIYLEAGNVTMNGGSFNENITQNDSGAIKVTYGTFFTANNVTFDQNKALNEEGGAIKNYGVTELNSCTFTSNNSSKEGGAIYNDKDSGDNSGKLTLTDCTFIRNNAGKNGGAIYSDYKLTINGGEIGGTDKSNYSQKNGGGIFVGGSSEDVILMGGPQITHNQSKNNADDNDGLDNVYLREDCKLTIGDSFTNGANIYITMEEETGVAVTNYTSDTPPSTYFHSDKDYSVVKDGTNVVITTGWDDLQKQINSAGNGATITLDRNYTASDDDDKLDVDGKQITIDLNGHKIDRSLSKKEDGGQVFDVCGNSDLTITDSSICQGEGPKGIICGGYSKDGGAIKIHKDSTLTITGGNITGNKSDDDGGAIQNLGTLNIQGSDLGGGKKSVVIENNQAFDQGGAIYSDDESYLTIENAIINNNHCDEEGGGINIFSKYPSTISNSIITNNTTTEIGGGINMEPDPFIIPEADFDRPKLTITNCTIEGNSADKRGGGIYLDDRGAIEISHTTLKNNTVTEQGGGIYIEEYAIFSADTVTIEANKANDKGGGVYNEGTKTTLTGCPIKDNSCGTSEEADDIDDFSGGGVYVAEDAKMTVKTCDITDNKATGNGGGIFADEDADGITFDGRITINSNTATFGTGVYLGEGDDDKITIGSEFDYDNSVINEIDAQNHEGVFTKDYSADKSAKAKTIFIAPKGFSVAYKESEHEVGFASSWKDLQNAINDNNGTDVLQLDQDYTALSDDERLNIPHDITIDLNGHTLNRNMQDEDDDGQVIYIEDDNKTLTVKNSSETPGVITGGDAKKGGAFMVQEDSTLNIESNVLIQGNKADVDGGAIYVKGTLNITGTQEKPVIIEGNYADDTGGAIYVDSEDGSQMTLEFVTIQSNSSNNSGGAMNLHNDEESTIRNCTITGNSAGSYGGAIRMASSGETLNIVDTLIDGNNSADDGGGICLYQGTINMTGTAADKCTVSNNTTNNDSGGVKVTDDTIFTATNVKINNNSASAEEGGGIKSYGDTTLTECEISNNNAAKEGGGIYNDGDMTLNNCTVNSNESMKKGGGIYNTDTLKLVGSDSKMTQIKENITGSSGGGIYGDDECEIQGYIVIQDNKATKRGNDYYISDSDYRLKVTEVLDNNTHIGVTHCSGSGKITKDYSEHNQNAQPDKFFYPEAGYAVTLKDGEAYIGSNWDELVALVKNAASNSTIKLEKDYAGGQDSDPLKVDKGRNITFDLNGHIANRAMKDAESDGHVFRVIEGSTLTITDSSNDKKGTIEGGYANNGGAINIEGGSTVSINAGNITGNKADDDGGAVYVHKGTLNISGGTISGNEATRGGAIFLDESDGAALNLSGGAITKNEASEKAGGIFADSKSESKKSTINISGNPVVDENTATGSANGIYLAANVLINITAALTQDAKLIVDKAGETGQITSGYSLYNASDVPTKYFSSSGYAVYLSGGEVYIGISKYGEDEYQESFLGIGDQINTDVGSLTGTNWMSGISGERLITEFNIPSSHDSGMNHIESIKLGDWTTFMPFGVGEFLAKTQIKYINEQMEDGYRVFDIRLNPVKKEFDFTPFPGYYWHDDGKNLYICHGKTIYGTYQALDPDGEYLSFNTILDWCADFLEKHPTETIVLGLSHELDVDYQNYYWENEVYERAGRILADFAHRTNPSTGESFLYKEPDAASYLDAYTHIPQLKECRGKILITGRSGQTGGYDDVDAYGITSYGGQEHTLNVEEKIDETNNHYDELVNKFGRVKLQSTADHSYTIKGTSAEPIHDKLDFLWKFSMNVTNEGHVFNYIMRRLGAVIDLSECAPYQFAKHVNGALFGDGKLFSAGDKSETNKTGYYLGWVSVDRADAIYGEQVWKTNFFNELKDNYYNVIVSPAEGLDPNRYTIQTYELLKGSTFDVPDNIYKGTGKYIDYWKVTDKYGNSTRSYPGDKYTINKDVTFTPVFIEGSGAPVRIEWHDGNDADGLRDKKIPIIVDTIVDGNKFELPATLSKEKNYSQFISADITGVKPMWGKIDPSESHGADREGYYRYESVYDPSAGYILHLYHTPVKQNVNITSVKGTVSWDDNNNVNNKRPIEVTVNLYKNTANGNEKVTSQTVTPSYDGTWTYEFDNLPKYDGTQEIVYTVDQDVISDYVTRVDEYNITNVLSMNYTSNLTGYVIWDDDNNASGKRPKKVTLHLQQNGADVQGIAPVTVDVNSFPFTYFCFKNVKLVDNNGKAIEYTVMQEDISSAGYTTTYKVVKEGDYYNYLVLNKSNRTQYEFKAYSSNKACTSAVIDPIFKQKTYDDLYNESTQLNVMAAIREGFKFIGWYKVTGESGGKVTSYGEKITPALMYSISIDENNNPGKIVAVYEPVEDKVIKGSIKWDDNNNEAKKRPANVKINLLQNGRTYKSQTVSATSNFSFDNLPYADNNAKDYTYTIVQDAIADYVTEVTVKSDGSFLITNTYQKKKYSFNVYSSNKECKAAIINPKVSPVKDIYEERDEITVNAVNKYGYEFLGWYEVDEVKNGKVTKYGKLVSTDIEYSFEIQQNTELVAVYQPKFTNDMWPTGVNGLKADNTAKVLLNNPDKNLPEGYTLMYAMGASSTSVPSDDNFTLTMPKGYSVGTYNIWVKIVGDDNHDCSIQPRCITVEVARDEENPEESGNYEDVPTTPGEVKDITGTEDAPNEENPYDVKIEDISNIPITEEQKKLGVNIWMEVLPLDPSSLSDEQKQKIASAAGDYTVCEYLDIALFVKIGPYNAMEIHQLKTASGFSFLCPIKYRQNDRQYSVVRLHEGTAKALPASYDSDSGRINVMSDQFSVYALAYKDVNDNTIDSDNQTNTTTTTTTTYTLKTKAAKTKDEFNIGYVFMSIIDKLF